MRLPRHIIILRETINRRIRSLGGVKKGSGFYNSIINFLFRGSKFDKNSKSKEEDKERGQAFIIHMCNVLTMHI